MGFFKYRRFFCLSQNICLVLVLLTATLASAQHGIGTHQPNPNAALHIEGVNQGVLLPKANLTDSTVLFQGVTATASHTGMLVYNTNTASNNGLAGVGYYQWNGTQWEKLTANSITNELIFDGEDDPSGTYDDYYYISMLINGTDWKVVRYDKTDVNAEAEATGTGAGNQPTTLAACIALTF